MMMERLATQGAARLGANAIFETEIMSHSYTRFGANATAGWPPAFLAQGLEFFIYFILLR